MTQTKAELLQTRHQGDIRLGDADSTHYVGFKAPATVSTSLVWTLPAADGTANYLLKTDGSGNLGWVADSSTDSTKMPLAGGTFTGNVTYNDNLEARFGTGADLKIYHRTSDESAVIKNANDTGFLRILSGDTDSSGILIKNANDDVTYLRAKNHDGVELFFNDVKTFATASDGIEVLGSEGGTANVYLYADEGDDNADKWKITSLASSSSFYLQNYSDGSWENSIYAGGGGAVKLSFDNSWRLETEDNGIYVYGPEGGVAHILLYADEGDDNADKWRIQSDTSGNFKVSNYSTGSWVDALIVDGPGRLGLKTSSMSSYNGSADDLVIDNGASDVGITLDSEGQCSIAFTDSAKTGWDGWMKYVHSNNSLQFGAGAGLALTLDSSQNATFVGAIYGPVKTVSALELDLSTGNYFIKTISGNSTFTFANPAASGTVTAFTLELTHSSGTVTWPASVKWNADTAPTLTTGKTHLFMFVTDDGGTRYRGSALVDYVN